MARAIWDTSCSLVQKTIFGLSPPEDYTAVQNEFMPNARKIKVANVGIRHEPAVMKKSLTNEGLAH